MRSRGPANVVGGIKRGFDFENRPGSFGDEGLKSPFHPPLLVRRVRGNTHTSKALFKPLSGLMSASHSNPIHEVFKYGGSGAVCRCHTSSISVKNQNSVILFTG